jgi:hypothetical protein
MARSRTSYLLATRPCAKSSAQLYDGDEQNMGKNRSQPHSVGHIGRSYRVRCTMQNALVRRGSTQRCQLRLIINSGRNAPCR